MPDLKALLAKSGLNQTGFAKLIHVNPRTVRRWFQNQETEGYQPITGPAYACLMMLAEIPELKKLFFKRDLNHRSASNLVAKASMSHMVDTSG
jgi:DNA-binding XRE family transcriptional regulator